MSFVDRIENKMTTPGVPKEHPVRRDRTLVPPVRRESPRVLPEEPQIPAKPLVPVRTPEKVPA